MVRLIGVNTPEIDGPYRDLECFGNEASDFTKSYLENQWITIEYDNTQGDRDKYDRLLRYVYLAGVDFGGFIINEGYGYEYTYNIPYVNTKNIKKRLKQKVAASGRLAHVTRTTQAKIMTSRHLRTWS